MSPFTQRQAPKKVSPPTVAAVRGRVQQYQQLAFNFDVPDMIEQVSEAVQVIIKGFEKQEDQGKTKNSAIDKGAA